MTLFWRRLVWILSAVGALVIGGLAWLYGRRKPLPIETAARERVQRQAETMAEAKVASEIARAAMAQTQAETTKHMNRADVAAVEARRARAAKERALAELRKQLDDDEARAAAFNARRRQRAVSGA